MGENEQGGMLRTATVVGLVALIAAVIIFGVTGLKNATSKTREDTVNKVENLSFYGRNLLLGSKNFSTTSGTNPWVGRAAPFVTNETYNGAKITATDSQWGGYKYNLGSLKNRGVLNEKDTYIMSAWFKNTSDTPVAIGFYAHNGTLGTHATDPDEYRVITLQPHGEWTRVVSNPFKFKNLDDEAISGIYIRFEPTDNTINGKVYQTSVKLEKGDQATDYTTAPEDN